MDNASIHRSDDEVRDVIARVGGSRCFVPPYSPDLNEMIEGAFGDTKWWLRRHRSVAVGYDGDSLCDADIVPAWDTAAVASPDAVLGRFRRAGYRVD